jgi:hypothetical protein
MLVSIAAYAIPPRTRVLVGATYLGLAAVSVGVAETSSRAAFEVL